MCIRARSTSGAWITRATGSSGFTTSASSPGSCPVCAGSSPDPMPLWPPLCPPRPVPWGFIWPGNTAAGAWRRSQISGRSPLWPMGSPDPGIPRCWPFGGWRSGSMKRRMTWCSPARADMTISSSRAGRGGSPVPRSTISITAWIWPVSYTHLPWPCRRRWSR